MKPFVPIAFATPLRKTKFSSSVMEWEDVPAPIALAVKDGRWLSR
jgi:hypothetical protein